jgi:hypothetical protein
MQELKQKHVLTLYWVSVIVFLIEVAHAILHTCQKVSSCVLRALCTLTLTDVNTVHTLILKPVSEPGYFVAS